MELIPEYLQSLALLLCCTAFVKIATVLSIARYGIGLYDFIFGAVVIIAALALALTVSAPLVEKLPSNSDFKAQVKYFEPFLQSNTDPDVSKRMQAIFQATNNKNNQKDQSENLNDNQALVVSAFLLSELKQAFRLGLLLLVPFLIIDLLVMNILMLLGVTQLSVSLIALPLKLLLFIAVDGWSLITEKLLLTYVT